MSTLNLSSNGPSISKSYQTVVNSPPPSQIAAGSPTFGQWAVFSVSTPLVNAFQRDAANKESVLKVQSSGEGDLTELIDEFSEGKIQFAFVKVTCPNTGLPKNVLIAWCGEGVPERTKGYFTSHLAAVSKLLHGYHVQVTARADGDLTPDGIIRKVGDASGSKYSPASQQEASSAPKPPVSTKPVFTPSRAVGATPKPPSTLPYRNEPKATAGDDGWGPDAPPVTRTGLEKVQPAYRPTKVNLQELRSATPPSGNGTVHSATGPSDVVKGGYQPIGKVDIAAIRRQARESGELRDDRPEPVKGTYEPVGKVDIAAIRARAQNPGSPPTQPEENDTGSTSGVPKPSVEAQSFDTMTTTGDAGRLTSLPKPKVSNKFGVPQTFTGTKPPLPSEPSKKSTSASVQIGSASRTFADQGGKTPAQIWAEKKAKEQGQGSAAATLPLGASNAPIQDQRSGQGEWKSSYTGKTWAPVQTTHTGKSIGSNTSQHVAEFGPEKLETESQITQPNVGAIRDQFMAEPARRPEPGPERSADEARAIPLPGLPSRDVEPETAESEAYQVAPSPPQQPRSPTPPTPPTPPVREASPIRVAMPVGRTVTDAHDEQHTPPPAIPTESLNQAVPNDQDLEDDRHDLARATAEATVDNSPANSGGLQAIVQYDYDKAEDNEIELKEGAYVTDIEMVDKDWWLGSNIHGERGLFPSNYVELVEPAEDQPPSTGTHATPATLDAAPQSIETTAPPATLGSANQPSAVALYDYEAAEDNELSFPEGVEIMNLEFPDDDWWFGEYRGKRGLFPANYVELRK